MSANKSSFAIVVCAIVLAACVPDSVRRIQESDETQDTYSVEYLSVSLVNDDTKPYVFVVARLRSPPYHNAATFKDFGTKHETPAELYTTFYRNAIGSSGVANVIRRPPGVSDEIIGACFKCLTLPNK
jgi:hypothetical protein